MKSALARMGGEGGVLSAATVTERFMREHSLVLCGLLAFSLVLTGCPDTSGGGGNNSPPPPVYDGSSPAFPQTIPIAAARDISTAWGAINSEVRAAGKYVILDLSKCDAQGNTISGAMTPLGNDMNIIKDNRYIKGIILPEDLESIGTYAFYNCASLTSVTIPATVTSIADSAFSGCSNLTSITAVAGSQHFSSEGGLLFNAGKTTLIAYPGGKSDRAYTIPDSVTTIEVGAFTNNRYLISVTIPATVTNIKNLAFQNCASLISVTFAEGSDISSENFPTSAFPYPNIRTLYLNPETGGAGTYTHLLGMAWVKE
jgi:hypothetical protein